MVLILGVFPGHVPLAGDTTVPMVTVQGPNGKYRIDQKAVSGLHYSACVDKKICPRPSYDKFNRMPDYRDEPAMSINWYMANAYCRHVDKRLPTLSEYRRAQKRLKWLGCCARGVIPREWTSEQHTNPKMGTQIRWIGKKMHVIRIRKTSAYDSATVRCAQDLK